MAWCLSESGPLGWGLFFGVRSPADHPLDCLGKTLRVTLPGRYRAQEPSPPECLEGASQYRWVVQRGELTREDLGDGSAGGALDLCAGIGCRSPPRRVEDAV